MWLIVLAVVGVGGVLVIAILAALAIPNITSAMEAAKATMAMSNMRQLHRAIESAVIDGKVEGNAAIGYPGDLAESTAMADGKPVRVRTVSDFLQRLVDDDALNASDMRALTAIEPYTGWQPNVPGAGKECGVKIYRYRERDPGDTIALSSRHFTYGLVQSSRVNYAIIQKNGAGTVHKLKRDLRAVGQLPGRSSAADRPEETPEDTLVQE